MLMSKKFILCIPVPFDVFCSFKSYVNVVLHRYDVDSYCTDWVLGYHFAHAEFSITQALHNGQITETQHDILWRFLENISLSFYNRFKLYKK